MDLRHQALCHTMTLCSPRSTEYQKNADACHLRGCWVLQGLGTSLSGPGLDQERSGSSFLKENEKALVACVLTSLLKGRDHVRVPKESQSTDSQPTMKGNKEGDKIQDLGQTAGAAFPAYVGSLGHFLHAPLRETATWKEKEAAPPGIHVWSVALLDPHILPFGWPSHLSSLGFSLLIRYTRTGSYSFPKVVIKLVGPSRKVFSTDHKATTSWRFPVDRGTAILLGFLLRHNDICRPGGDAQPTPDAGKVSGTLETKYKWCEHGLTFTEKWNTDNTLGTETATEDQIYRGLNVTFDTTFSPNTGKKSGKIKSAYKRERLNLGCHVDFDFAGPLIFHGSLVMRAGLLGTE
ncbi:hypothetical protein ACRRTK_013732 [Alexandromys fortis]